MLNYFGIDKLHGFIMYSVMLAVGHIPQENDYSFQFSNVGSYGIPVLQLFDFPYSSLVKSVRETCLIRGKCS